MDTVPPSRARVHIPNQGPVQTLSSSCAGLNGIQFNSIQFYLNTVKSAKAAKAVVFVSLH